MLTRLDAELLAQQLPSGAIALQSLGAPADSQRTSNPSVIRSVMVTSREDDDLFFGDDVDEAVLIVDSP